MTRSNVPGRRPLSAKTRLYIFLGVGFPCLAWMKYLSPGPSSGKWGAIERLLMQMLGREGVLLALVAIGVLFLSLALPDVLARFKRKD